MTATSSDRAEDGADPALHAARSIVLAHVLPLLKAHGRGAGQPHGLARPTAGEGDRIAVAGPAAERLAAALHEALTNSSADAAEREGADRARAAFATLPPGLVHPRAQQSAIVAAGAEARLYQLAKVLRNRSSTRSDSAAETSALPAPLVQRHCRSAATVEAAVSMLDALEPRLDGEATTLASRLRSGPVAPPPDRRAAARLRTRVRAARRRRIRRGLALSSRLALLGVDAGGTPSSHAPSVDPQVLRWLQELLQMPLHTSDFEETRAHWTGPDPFGLRSLPPPPDFLAQVDVTVLPARHVAPFLRRLSMVRARPAAGDLLAAGLDEELGQSSSGISAFPRSAAAPRWGPATGEHLPELPATTEIPHVVHGIWLGTALPDNSSFWENYGTAARHFADRVDFVFWTDIPRARFEAAGNQPPPKPGRRDALQFERRLLDWARTSGIHLVNVFEVFHSLAPMALHDAFVLEMAKQLPRGYASASDLLRVELVERFGGGYVDGDNSFADEGAGGGLAELFDEVAASPRAFTLNPVPGAGVSNDVIVAPAHHPFLLLWRECTRINYFRTQPELFGGLDAMAQRFVGHPRQCHRYIAPSRTGRVHHWALALLGIDSATLPDPDPALFRGSELSWIPRAGAEPTRPAERPRSEVVAVLTRCATFLRWQLIAREGDLYLTAVDPVLRSLPDPDAAWIALLAELSRPVAGVPAVTSLTDQRREDDGRLTRVGLPPEAEVLLDRKAEPGTWVGASLSSDGKPIWLLDERCTPARLRGPGEPLPSALSVLAELAEVAVDPLGGMVGLWVREPAGADVWRCEDRFAAVPCGQLGISFGGPRLAVWDSEPAFRVDALAVLIAGLGEVHRPVLLCSPPSQAARMAVFAQDLRRLLDVPVVVRRPGGPPPGVRGAGASLLPQVRYLPYFEYRDSRRKDVRAV